MDDYSSGFCIKASRGGYGGGGGGATIGTKCGRWNPTSEQVKVLTELFRSGLRTPSTDQIQKISSELSYYGKIESKNVFYWFQNHKARERQKRRRVLVDESNDIQINLHHDHRHLNNFSTKHYGDETNEVVEQERVIETLQLFPLNTLSETDSDHKLRFYADDCKEKSSPFAYNFGTEMDHPTLDLRLSFV